MKNLKIAIIDDKNYFKNKLHKYYNHVNVYKKIEDINIKTSELLIVNFDYINEGCVLKKLGEIDYHNKVIFFSKKNSRNCYLEFVPYNIKANKLIEKIENLNSVDVFVNHVLELSGISEKLTGHTYIKDSIKILYEHHISIKELYSILGAKYNKSSISVERSIRTAIENSFSRPNRAFIIKIFNDKIPLNKDRPTNSEYIYSLIDFIKSIN